MILTNLKDGKTFASESKQVKKARDEFAKEYGYGCFQDYMRAHGCNICPFVVGEVELPEAESESEGEE